jgi:hypothetical protein
MGAMFGRMTDIAEGESGACGLIHELPHPLVPLEWIPIVEIESYNFQATL